MKKVLYFAALALVLASCSQKARISMTVADAPSEKLAVYKLGVTSSELLDSVSTDAGGKFAYKVDVAKGQGEFVYIYRGDTRLAALLLFPSDKVEVSADTLGNFSVSGSADCELLCSVENDYLKFQRDLAACEDSKSVLDVYLPYYRGRVSYVLAHDKSLTCIPVLYQNLSAGVPVFSQHTDAIIFRRICDSLKTVYPESRFVKALDVQTKNRENQFALSAQLAAARVAGYPEMNLPDVNSEKVSLTGLDAKVKLVHFWDVRDASQKLFNTEVLLPLYREFHRKGLEIYSVCVSTDKALWASVVRNQNLPWVNVCDGLGAASSAVRLYNVQSLPYSMLIAGEEVSSAVLTGEAALRSELRKLLK